MRIKMKGGDEFDYFSRYRKFLRFKRGDGKLIKRKYNKRLRKYLKCKLNMSRKNDNDNQH